MLEVSGPMMFMNCSWSVIYQLFLILEADTDTEDTKTPQVDTESCASSIDTSFQTKLFGFVSNIKGHFNKMLGEHGGSDMTLETAKPNTLWEDLCFPGSNNPYLSPYCASDEDLKKFPPTKILVSHLKIYQFKLVI